MQRGGRPEDFTNHREPSCVRNPVGTLGASACRDPAAAQCQWIIQTIFDAGRSEKPAVAAFIWSDGNN
jgi:hypothetical protein